MIRGFIAAALALAAPVAAQLPLDQRITAEFKTASPGTRFGLVVADETGRELIAIDPDGRYIPASNTKMVTTAAAFALLGEMTTPDADGGTEVRIEPARRGPSDVVLVGRGDARLSSAAACVANCLATLADAVAAQVRVVRHVIGDDSLFPDERWSPGMSWNNIPTRSGTAASALSLDDNELIVTVRPGASGKPPVIEASRYYEIDNRAVTGGTTALAFDRAPNDRRVRLSGSLAVGATPAQLRLGIDDPAHYAAWTFARMLKARGVAVMGEVSAQHRPLVATDDPARRGMAPPVRAPWPAPLARLVPPPLIEDMRIINKASQNLHAELLLRRLGLLQGSGSIADGRAAVAGMLATAGVPRAAYDLSDGSGMSSYNRLSPRGTAGFLRWIAAQPWGSAWRATLPVGGTDGTLTRRFAGTALHGKVFAKTGTLNATSALSGYLIARSGRVLTFSALANDIPDGASASAAVDAALLLIAAEN